MRLEGKVALVTGSSSGIGRACVELFAEEGATVVVNDHGAEPELGPGVVEAIRNKGGSATYRKADVRNGAEVRELVRSTLEAHGRLDVLMNNAVAGRIASVVDMEEGDWDPMFAATIKAVAVACKEAIPEMIRHRGGSIINTSSIHGLGAARDHAPYAAFKAALIHLTRQIAVDYGRFGVRCNALCPGRIVTEAKRRWLEENPHEILRQKYVYPLGRPGTPREAAMAALFLASDESSFITGHALVVDGGLTAQLPDHAATVLHEGILAELSGSRRSS